MEFLHELSQNRQIIEASQDAARARSKGDELTLEVNTLKRRVDRLSLTCQALWEVLAQETNITEAQIRQKIHEIDARDGAADGKRNRAPVPCPHCGRPASPTRPRCMYCNGELGTGAEHLFG